MGINCRPSAIDSYIASGCLKSVFKYEPLLQRFQRMICRECLGSRKPKHLICFKQWNAKMVLDVVCSARNLKAQLCDTHQQKLNFLANGKVLILQEVNQPMLTMAVSKAASLLGADDVGINDRLVWDTDYTGRIFSAMADIIFVSTDTHHCLQRFANKSSVPVLCMQSRTHASILSLATIMTIMENFGSVEGHNIAWVGPPHPVLNSYLLLMPMLGANIRFKCCCKVCPVSPLLLKDSQEMTKSSSTTTLQCQNLDQTLCNASVVIAGPTCTKKEKLPEFTLSVEDITKRTCCPWIFLHTCPRGGEVNDLLFQHPNSRTFNAFENMHFIAAALMAYHVKDYTFS